MLKFVLAQVFKNMLMGMMEDGLNDFFAEMEKREETYDAKEGKKGLHYTS